MPNLRYPAEKKDTAWLVEFPRQKKTNITQQQKISFWDVFFGILAASMKFIYLSQQFGSTPSLISWGSLEEAVSEFTG